MPAGYASATNTYAPSTAASQSLIVNFSRNISTFGLPKYAQYVMAKKMQGLYWVWASRQGARIISDIDSEHVWQDGDAAPVGPGEQFSVKGFMTTRRAYSFLLGALAVEQADFEILAGHAAMAAMQCMTARTMLVHNALANVSWGANTAAVDGTILPGGQDWSTGSVGYSSNPGPNIKKSLQYGSLVVHKATLGAVQPWQLALVINPVTAMMMAASTEIQDYMKQSQFAASMLTGRGREQGLNSRWNLPDYLYDHPVVVEDAVRVKSNIGAADDIQYVMPDDTAYLIARQGELQGFEGSRSYSTIQVFFHKDEMTVESKYDSDNKRYMGRVVTNFQPVVVAPSAGFKFTSVGTPTP